MNPPLHPEISNDIARTASVLARIRLEIAQRSRRINGDAPLRTARSRPESDVQPSNRLPQSNPPPSWWSPHRSHPSDRQVLAEARARDERARAERLEWISAASVCHECRRPL